MIRFVRSLLTVKCPLCRSRTRNLPAHVWVDHAGEAS